MANKVSTAGVSLVPITKIVVGLRRRKKLTNIPGLARSIELHGLAHPILIRGGRELVAGRRRLAAFERLVAAGKKEFSKIPARHVEKLSDAELRALELDENVFRDDYNTLEVTHQRLAEIRALEAEEKEKEKGADNGTGRTKKRPHRKTGGKGGRPKKPGSKRDTAEKWTTSSNRPTRRTRTRTRTRTTRIQSEPTPTSCD